MTSLRRAADAVVVGGGAIGASAVFHLAALGLKHVVLLEQRVLAAGATGRSAAHIQLGESPEAEARITLASLPYYLHWDELVGAGSCGFRSTGYMRLHPYDDRERTRTHAGIVASMGVEARVLDPYEARDIAPYLALDDVDHVHYQPLAGHASSSATTFGFAERAGDLGAEILEHVKVLGVERTADHVAGVRTSAGTVSTPIVILAAGAWNGALLAALGLELPLQAVRTQVAVLTWPTSASARQIMSVSDAVGGYTYFSSEGADDRHVVVGLGREGHQPLADLEGYEEMADPEYAEAARRRFVMRVPAAEYIRGSGGWAGPVTVTPDKAPIIDEHPEISGLYFAAGCNGTGFKGSPAVGRALAEWATSGSPRVVDLTSFRAARFSPVGAGS